MQHHGDGESPPKAATSEDKQEPIPSSQENAPVSTADSQWAFHNEGESQAYGRTGQEPRNTGATSVSWTASEYIAHPKGPTWFIGYGLALAALGTIIFLITGDKIAPIMIGIMGILFGIFAGRQPQTLSYTLDHHGVQLGPKLYTFESFKSFSVIPEGATRSILLMPLRRFMPAVSFHYAPEDEDKIINILGSYLPHEDRQPDLIDQLMRKIRF
jgi:hypothetical protein